MAECLFCGVVARDVPASIIHEDDDTIAFLDIAPLARGHTLVIPREHCVDLFDIGAERAARVMRSAVGVAKKLDDALAPAGMNLLHASRAAAWQTVFHFHLHLLPRYPDDAVRPMFLARSIAEREELDAVAAQINGS